MPRRYGHLNGNKTYAVKLILISIVVLFGVLTFVFLLFPDHIQVSRISAIRATPEKIMQLVRDTSGWKNWNRFYAGDKSPSVIMTVLKDSTNQFITAWTKQSGKSFNGTFTVTPSGQENVVQWTLDFRIKWYPWERMASMFYEKQLGPAMDGSLTELKKLAERD